MTEAIQNFKRYIRYELNQSVYTEISYISDITDFAKFITGGDEDSFDPLSVTESDVRCWLSDLASNGIKPRSIRRKTSSLRAFYRFLKRRHGLKSDPVSDLSLAKIPVNLPKFVREDEMETLLSDDDAVYSEKTEFEHVRNMIAVEILYSTGIRRAELLALQDKDIDFSRQEMKVTGKRSKQRIIPLPSAILEKIDCYLRLRNESIPASERADAFLLTKKGTPMNKSSLYCIIKEKLGHTSSDKNSPHVLRHTFATTMLNNGAGLMEVKELLGHASLNSTQVYTHVSFAELKKNYQQAHPRAVKKENDHGSNH